MRILERKFLGETFSGHDIFPQADESTPPEKLAWMWRISSFENPNLNGFGEVRIGENLWSLEDAKQVQAALAKAIELTEAALNRQK